MNLNASEIFLEYKAGCEFKASVGARGISEQSKINERFFLGDQWYGAKISKDKPLVRHNVIKRIGDYKMSQILNQKISVEFSAEGDTFNRESDANGIMKALSEHFGVCAERVNLEQLSSEALKNAYISGSALLYTYWNPAVTTGTFADAQKTVPIKGDISCELLKIEDTVFADPYCDKLQLQPYIIVAAKRNTDEVISEARRCGAAASTLKLIENDGFNGKVMLLTKLYKTFSKESGTKVMAVRVTANAVVRPAFCTNLRLYPLAQLNWESKSGFAYGESEVTHLIPNQIAINRLITANVWSSLSNGLPIMLVNGDTVNEKITNDPAQIIKVYGSNEDVAGAVKYVTPPSLIKEFDDSINNLINNTLTQSGASEVALGDMKAENATALTAMQNAALMPLKLVRGRYHAFLEDLARIWADFWVTHCGDRQIKLKSGTGYRYAEFNADRYKSLIINAKLSILTDTAYTEKEQLEALLTLFDKGIISKLELLERLPKGLIPKKDEILTQGGKVNDGQ